MSKPWLKTWFATEDGDVAEQRGRICVIVARDAGDESSELMAAAPDMCRALLAVEYAAVHQEENECSLCSMPPGHHHNCTLDAALTKAGLPDQASRDAARKGLAL